LLRLYKWLLVALTTLIPDQGLAQVSYVLLVSVAFSLLHGYLQPFESRYDDSLQSVTSISTLLLGFYALLIKTETEVDPTLGWLMFTLNTLPLLLLAGLLLWAAWISGKHAKITCKRIAKFADSSIRKEMRLKISKRGQDMASNSLASATTNVQADAQDLASAPADESTLANHIANIPAAEAPQASSEEMVAF
jgi:hypothetical protein